MKSVQENKSFESKNNGIRNEHTVLLRRKVLIYMLERNERKSFVCCAVRIAFVHCKAHDFVPTIVLEVILRKVRQNSDAEYDEFHRSIPGKKEIMNVMVADLQLAG